MLIYKCFKDHIIAWQPCLCSYQGLSDSYSYQAGVERLVGNVSHCPRSATVCHNCSLCCSEGEGRRARV